MKKVLLLTNSYEFNAFIEEIRAVKLIVKGKAEVISTWNDRIYYGKGFLPTPAILRLNFPIKTFGYKVAYTFNREAIVRRDKSICQYCGKPLLKKEITIDHVIPKGQGGANTFTNCVVSCFKCNHAKGNKTPEQASMALMNKPYIPKISLISGPEDGSWHPDWDDYLGI